MQIWIVEATEPLPQIDGNYRELRCGMLVRALVAGGHEVTWWTSTFDHNQKRHRFPQPRVVDLSPQLRLNLLHGPGYRKNISLERVWHHRALAQAFERSAMREESRPDIVFTCLPIPELAEKAVQYGRSRGISVIVDVRDPWPDLYPTILPPFLRPFMRLGLIGEFARTRRILRLASAITAVSDTYLAWALAHARRDRQEVDGVFPLGYRVPAVSGPTEALLAQLRARYGLRPEALVVVFAGMFGASYDLETVVEAARLLEATEPRPVQIVLAGDGDTAPQIRQKAGAASNVIFTGWLDQAALQSLLQLAHVGLAAYREGALQSLPNKPFEYMAAGLPLLSSLRGELEALIREGQIGLQYQAGDARSLVEAIRWLVAHPAARHDTGVRARQLFETRFSAEAIYPRLAEHIERMARQEFGRARVSVP